MDDTPSFLRRKEAGQYIKDKYGFGSGRALGTYATLGGGPPFRKVGLHLKSPVVYERAALDERDAIRDRRSSFLPASQDRRSTWLRVIRQSWRASRCKHGVSIHALAHAALRDDLGQPATIIGQVLSLLAREATT